jgi:hypothetical protein
VTVIILQVALGALVAPCSAAAWSRLIPALRREFLTGWVGGCVCGGASAVIISWRPYAIGAAISLAVALAVWWHRRKKRRRGAALLGAKSKALRDALVRRVRQSGRPRPVLIPVPGGAQ